MILQIFFPVAADTATRILMHFYKKKYTETFDYILAFEDDTIETYFLSFG